MLADAGDPVAPSTVLLHAIAHEIQACCGHHPLKCHRLAWGWSAREAVEAFHAMCDINGLERRGLNERSLRSWESGAPTNRTYGDLLSQLYATNAVQLGFVADYTPTAGEPLIAPRIAAPGPAPGRRHAGSGDLGEATAERTGALLATLAAGAPSNYTPPSLLDRGFSEFIASSAQVFTLVGPPGCGKTTFINHAARARADHAHFQLHAATAWAQAPPGLAGEILHYATLEPGADAIVELREHVRSLRRPTVVVIDGIASQDHLGPIGADVERILRLVSGPLLKFVLAIRTPPPATTSMFPVLDASTYRSGQGSTRHPSYSMTTWTTSEARGAWDRDRDSSAPTFDQLPAGIQQLATLPLYMRLLLTAGTELGEATTPYRLLDHCVRASIDPASRPERALSALAGLARREVKGELMGLPEKPDQDDLETPLPASSPLLQASSTGSVTFVHDVIREYFLATDLAAETIDRGRSAGIVRATNELAAQATTSSMARTVLEFTVQALDHQAPELVGFIATSPIVDVTTTLPLIVQLAPPGSRYTSDEFWRSCADRSDDAEGIELARALLDAPGCAAALGDHVASWLIALLRRFGSRIWPSLAQIIESGIDATIARQVLDLADLDSTSEATFVARHLGLFVTDPDLHEAHVELLVGHPDWRVRAALVTGLALAPAPVRRGRGGVFDRLARDGDYKVRVAVSDTISDAGPEITRRHLGSLLRDDNWHVRARLLDALADIGQPDSSLIEVAVEVLTSDATWRACPAHHQLLRERLFIRHGIDSHNREARQQALFTLLREHRTGTRPLPDALLQAVATEAAASPGWLAAREARQLAAQPTLGSASGATWRAQRDYRRLRDARVVQVALDLADIEQAILVAEAAARAGVELIEIGDPLIKEVGLDAVTRVKRAVPEVTVVAEMMSADWGRDQVVLAAQAGADIAFLIGPATVASVAAAVDAGRRMGVPVVLDVPARHVSQQWIQEMEQVGVDGFTVTTNIDLGVSGSHPFTTAQLVRGWSRLPVAVSGGFSPSDGALLANPHWDIVIVGRSVAEAVNPKAAAAQIIAAIRTPPSEP